MPALKNQHFVPRFYFRLFSIDGKNALAYNLKREESFRAPIKHLGSKPYYYSKDPKIESSISQLEGHLAKVIQAIVADKRIPTTQEEYVLMFCFIAVQHSRTPVAKTKGEQVIQNLSDEIINSVAGLNSGVKLVDPVIQLRQVLNGLQFAPLLFDMVPVLLLNETDSDFIFSDNPTVFHNNYFGNVKNFGHLGYQSPGLQIFCPLGTKMSLMFFDPECYLIRDANSDYVLHVKSQDDIELINSLQFINCHENIFYSDENQEKSMQGLHNNLRGLMGKNKVVVERISSKDGNKVREFLHTYEYRPPFDLKLSFVTNNLNADVSKLARHPDFCERVMEDVKKKENKYRAKHTL